LEELKGVNEEVLSIVRKSLEVLSRYPLCDRCLGRLFARYGLGVDNKLRGKAIKTLLLMTLHKEVERGVLSPDAVNDVIRNSGYPLINLRGLIAKENLGTVKCYICNNELDILIGEAAIKASSKLGSLDVRTFLVGVRAGSLMERREAEIVESLGIESWESIRREVKREVGKAIQRLTGLRPNFKEPDALVIIDLDRRDVEVNVYPLYLLGRYLKLGRYISQMDWVLKDGSLKYELSIETVCRELARALGGKEVVIHAAGREDVDVRMLGNGRPLVIEVKEPIKRYVDYDRIAREVSSRFNNWVKLIIKESVPPSIVTKVKEEVHQKNYLAVTYVEEGISDEDVNKIKNTFKNLSVRQLTPLRVLRRRKEVLRIKRVYEVDGIKLSDRLAAFLIRCDGGLYVKELINGDKGRTEPSFSSVLGKSIEVVSLDVIHYLGF